MAFGLEGAGRGGGLKHKEGRNSPSSLPSLHHIGNCGKGGGISDGGVSIYRQGGELRTGANLCFGKGKGKGKGALSGIESSPPWVLCFGRGVTLSFSTIPTVRDLPWLVSRKQYLSLIE